MLKRFWNLWATRSLLVGAIATAIDLTTGVFLLSCGVSILIAARVGVAIGSTFAFTVNRYFTFRDHNPKITADSLAFIASMAFVVTMLSVFAAGFVPPWWRAAWLLVAVCITSTIPLQLYRLRHSDAALKTQVVQFVISTSVAILIHGWLVVWLRDSIGIPFVVSKMLADLLVFTFVQLLLLRYLVFKPRETFVRQGE